MESKKDRRRRLKLESFTRNETAKVAQRVDVQLISAGIFKTPENTSIGICSHCGHYQYLGEKCDRCSEGMIL